MLFKVVDSPMGTGKTTAIIHEVNNNKDKKYIVVVPYLKEVDRIENNTSCVQPTDEIAPSKIAKLSALIEQRNNIVCTHSLLTLFDDNILRALDNKGYCIVIDELPSLICQHDMILREQDIPILREHGCISVDENNHNKISWTSKLGEKDIALGRLKTDLETRDLYFYNDLNLISFFRLKTWSVFNEVVFCTYRFKDSYLDYYCQFFDIQVELFHVETLDNSISLIGSTGEYDTIDCQFSQGYKLEYPIVTKRIALDISERYNSINKSDTLSVSYFKNNVKFKKGVKGSKDTYELADNIANIAQKAKNFIRKHENADKKTNNVIWTTFGSVNNENPQRNYKKALFKKELRLADFIPCNTLGTNDYQDCTIVCYLCGIYLNPNVERFLNRAGIQVSKTENTLSTLLQFIWRSNIRNIDSDKIIHVLVAAPIIRKSLARWLEKANAKNFD